MNNPINDIFGKNDGLDPFGPYSRDEHKITDVNGVKIAIREVHLERMGHDGTRQVFVNQQYLCKDCGKRYVTLGQTGCIVDNNILCDRCALISKIIWWLTPIWSPFIVAKKPESK